MQTRTLVEATANVVTITALKRGDVYKRLPKSHEYGTDLYFGIVQDVMANGSDTAFTALEFGHDATNIGVKVHKGDSDLALFAAQPEEVENQMERLEEQALANIEKARQALAKADAEHTAVFQQRMLIEGQGLSAPAISAGVIEGEVA